MWEDFTLTGQHRGIGEILTKETTTVLTTEVKEMSRVARARRGGWLQTGKVLQVFMKVVVEKTWGIIEKNFQEVGVVSQGAQAAIVVWEAMRRAMCRSPVDQELVHCRGVKLLVGWERQVSEEDAASLLPIVCGGMVVYFVSRNVELQLIMFGQHFTRFPF